MTLSDRSFLQCRPPSQHKVCVHADSTNKIPPSYLYICNNLLPLLHLFVSVPPSLCYMGISRHTWLLCRYANQMGYWMPSSITYLPFSLSSGSVITESPNFWRLTHTRSCKCTHTHIHTYRCMSMLVSKTRCPWSPEEVILTPGTWEAGFVRNLI